MARPQCHTLGAGSPDPTECKPSLVFGFLARDKRYTCYNAMKATPNVHPSFLCIWGRFLGLVKCHENARSLPTFRHMIFKSLCVLGSNPHRWLIGIQKRLSPLSYSACHCQAMKASAIWNLFWTWSFGYNNRISWFHFEKERFTKSRERGSHTECVSKEAELATIQHRNVLLCSVAYACHCSVCLHHECLKIIQCVGDHARTKKCIKILVRVHDMQYSIHCAESCAWSSCTSSSKILFWFIHKARVYHV